MIVVARAVKGKEFLYSASSAHRVAENKAQKIAVRIVSGARGI